MALFQGEEMINVTTPDGRTLTLPRSIVPANMMPQQIAPGGPPAGAFGVPAQQPAQEAPAPAYMPPPENPAADPNVVEGGSSVVEMGEPETRRVTQQQLRKEQESLQAQQMKAQKQAAARAATPAGKIEGAQAAQDQATQGEAQAVFSAADLEAAEQEVIGDAVTKRNEQLDKRALEKVAALNAVVAEEDAKRDEVAGWRKKIAGTKIDRSADHPIMLAISAALVGLGQAMNGEKITSYDVITNAIDRKVAAQESDLDRMGKIYGMTKDELDELKQKKQSTLEFHNMMIAAETDKAVRHIEEITARSASEKTKANAKVLIAQLQTRAADKAAEAMRWGLEFDQRDKHQKQQMQLGWANHGESVRHNKAGEQFDREKAYLDYQKALAADKAAGDKATFEARMKSMDEVEKRGIKGMGGEYLLTPEGRAKMEQATKLEEEAKALRGTGAMTPAQQGRADLLEQKAAVLRGDANSFDVVKARSDTQAGELSKKYAAAQGMLDVIDEINSVYTDVGRQVLGRDAAQQKLQSLYKLLNVKGKDAWQLGAWDKGSATLSKDIFGDDPSAWAAKTLAYAASGGTLGDDPSGFRDRLEAVARDAQNTVGLEYQTNTSWRGAPPDLFTRKKDAVVSESAKQLSQGRSGTEIEKNADETGVVGQAARRGYQVTTDMNAPSVGEEAEGAASSAKYPGMSRAQEAPYEDLMRKYKAGGPEGKRAAEEIVATVAQAAAKRPDFIVPLLHNLREHAPQLYTAARAAVPKNSQVDEQMTYEEQARIGTAGEAPDMLGATVLNSIKDDGTVGDIEGYRELARRAGRGDQMAKKAIGSIVAASGSRKSRMQQDAAALDSMQKAKGKMPAMGRAPAVGSHRPRGPFDLDPTGGR